MDDNIQKFLEQAIEYAIQLAGMDGEDSVLEFLKSYVDNY